MLGGMHAVPFHERNKPSDQCDYSSMVERWIVAPIMTVQLRLVTPF